MICCILLFYYKNTKKTCISIHLLVSTRFTTIVNWIGAQMNFFNKKALNNFSKTFENDDSNKLKARKKSII